MAAAPCAVSAVFHSGIGSMLAFAWGRFGDRGAGGAAGDPGEDRAT